MAFLDTILEIIFPVKCIECDTPGSDLCVKCVGKAKIDERESENWIFPIFDYRHPSIKKSLWLLKYKGKKRLARIFARILYDRIIEELSELSVMENFTNIILIPIPLAKGKHRERGYNQAELLCKELIKLDKDHLFRLEKDILIKKYTNPQAHIKNKQERLKNISGSFAINNREKKQKLLKNKNIILIDDILTTGATLTEARKILIENRARMVIAFTVAH